MIEEMIRAMVREEMEKVARDVAISVVCQAIRGVVNPTYQTPEFKEHIANIAVSACKNSRLRNE